MKESTVIETLKLISEIETIRTNEWNSLFGLSDAFHKKYEEEKKRLPYHINVIDELHINENGHSRILCKLLCFTNSKGEFEILESLVDYIIRTSHLSEFERIEITNPIITQEISRIDLWVRDREKKYAMIFENKIYNATDQEAQLSRYIEKTIADGFNLKNIFVVYLSQSGREPDPQSWGEYKNEFASRYVNLSFKYNILPWLKNVVLPNIREKDLYLKNAVNQYIDYLEGLFLLRTIYNTMNMNLDNLISEHLGLDKCNDYRQKACLLQEKMDELQKLIAAMQSLKERTREKIFEEWKQATKERFPELHPLEQGCYTDVTLDNIHGKKVIVFITDDEKQLYCQVQFDDSLSEEEKIIEDTEIMKLRDILPSNNKNCIWKYFLLDDYDGVFNLFLEAVERCKKLAELF